MQDTFNMVNKSTLYLKLKNNNNKLLWKIFKRVISHSKDPSSHSKNKENNHADCWKKDKGEALHLNSWENEKICNTICIIYWLNEDQKFL